MEIIIESMLPWPDVRKKNDSEIRTGKRAAGGTCKGFMMAVSEMLRHPHSSLSGARREQPGGISVGKKGSPTCRRSPGCFRPKNPKLSADAASFDRGGHLRLPLRRKAPASWP